MRSLNSHTNLAILSSFFDRSSYAPQNNFTIHTPFLVKRYILATSGDSSDIFVIFRPSVTLELSRSVKRAKRLFLVGFSISAHFKTVVLYVLHTGYMKYGSLSAGDKILAGYDELRQQPIG